MIRIFLADDHAVVRESLARVISSTMDMTVVGSAEDGRQVLTAAESETPWDVLVLDLSLPRVSGIEVLRRLHTLRPSLPVLVLSMYPEEQYALQLLRQGAAAYLSKDRSLDELLEVIRRLHRGKTYLTEKQAEQLVRVPDELEASPHTRLSAREHQIFVLIINGHSVSDIAAELNLAMSTVSTHLARVKEKLNARSNADLISYAHRAGLVS